MRDLIGAIGRKPVKVTDWAGLVEVLRAGAAYLSQGASYSYLRARSGLAGPRLFQDEGFGFALNICKWEGFAAAAQDLVLVVEAEMRPEPRIDRMRLADALAALYRDILAAEPVPDHRKTAGWEDLEAEFAARLPAVLQDPPRRPEVHSVFTARRLLQHAPIDDTIRAYDEEMVVNNVAFRFTDHLSHLRRSIDFSATAQDIARRVGAA